jgi:hydroxymethylglutaryl-CoA reductase (NADPH)
MIDESRETYVFLMEYLDPGNIAHINSQKNPELWTRNQIKSTIEEITKIHLFFQDENNRNSVPEITEFRPWEAKNMYQKFISIMLNEAIGTEKYESIKQLAPFPEQLENDRNSLTIANTVIHNDFNSRNIAIRKPSTNNETAIPCIYDWELAVLDIPHRDIVEFLSFVLVENFDPEELFLYLDYHYNLYKNHSECTKFEWWQGYVYAIKEFLVTRVSFYEVAGIHAKYTFSERILKCGFRILDLVEEQLLDIVK